MPADFTPTLEGYTGQGAFKFWCQKVLPLVYDDSLSYYELLNKVVDYLNNTIKDVSALENNTNEIYRAYLRLQEYVNLYFERLDVQTEIDNKLDQMVEDGTFDQIINSKLFDNLDARVRTNTTAIYGLNTTKITRNQSGVITYDMLSPDLQRMMTGTAVPLPTVGANTVNTAAIQTGAVTGLKMANSAKVTTLNGKIQIDYDLKTITIPVGSNFTSAGNSAQISQAITLDYSTFTNGAYWIQLVPADTANNVPVTGLISASRDMNNYILGRLFYGEFYWTSPVIIEDVNAPLSMSYGSPVELRLNRVIIDLQNNRIIPSRSANMLLNIGGNYVNINTTNSEASNYQDDIEITVDFGLLAYDSVTNKLVALNGMANYSDRYSILGGWNRPYNKATLIIPYTVITNATKNFNVCSQIMAIGDSITAGAGTSRPYCDVIEKISGIRILNYGIGSTGYGFDLPAGTHLAGQGTTEVGINTEIGAENSFYNRVKYFIDNGTAQDIILLFGGTNDWSANIQPETFATSVRNAISYAHERGYRVGVIGPIRRKANTVNQDGIPVNSLGLTIQDYSNIIKNITQTIGVPFLEMTKCGLDPTVDGNKTKYFTDNVHPNNKGQEVLAINILNFVKANFSILQDNL